MKREGRMKEKAGECLECRGENEKGEGDRVREEEA